MTREQDPNGREWYVKTLPTSLILAEALGCHLADVLGVPAADGAVRWIGNAAGVWHSGGLQGFEYAPGVFQYVDKRDLARIIALDVVLWVDDRKCDNLVVCAKPPGVKHRVWAFDYEMAQVIQPTGRDARVVVAPAHTRLELGRDPLLIDELRQAAQDFEPSAGVIAEELAPVWDVMGSSDHDLEHEVRLRLATLPSLMETWISEHGEGP